MNKSFWKWLVIRRMCLEVWHVIDTCSHIGRGRKGLKGDKAEGSSTGQPTRKGKEDLKIINVFHN